MMAFFYSMCRGGLLLPVFADGQVCKASVRHYRLGLCTKHIYVILSTEGTKNLCTVITVNLLLWYLYCIEDTMARFTRSG